MYPIDTQLEPHLLKWWMLTREFTRRAAGEQARTVLPKINVRALSKLPVPLPPPSEQRRIVEILEDHLSRLDAASDLLRSTAARWDALWRSAVEGEVTGHRVNGVREGPCLSAEGVDDGKLSSLPAGWSWTRLGDVADVVGGVTKDAKKQGDPTYIEVPYLRVANVQRGRLDLDEVTSIRVPPATASKLRLVPGDVLLNEGGDRDKLGRGWVWEGQIDDCIHQNHVFRARVRDGAIEPYLLSWAANSIGGRWCERNGRQSVNLASISLSKIKLMPVPLPPQRDQASIVVRLKALVDAGTKLRNDLKAAAAREQALRRSLLTAAFSGQLTHAESVTQELAHV
jgi:type I restriction enzyme S subunit